MLKNQNFGGSAPDLSRGVYWGAYIAPLDLLEGTRCPLLNNPTPVLGLSITPRFYMGLRVKPITKLPTVNMIINIQ